MKDKFKSACDIPKVYGGNPQSRMLRYRTTVQEFRDFLPRKSKDLKDDPFYIKWHIFGMNHYK